MRKLVTAFKLFAVLSVLALNSCQDENIEIPQDQVSKTVSVSDLKKEITPGLQELPKVVQTQLEDSKVNLGKYLRNDLQITGVTILGRLGTPQSIEISKKLISEKEGYIAFGNITDPASVKTGKMNELYSGNALSIAQSGLRELAEKEIKPDMGVIEITWKNNKTQFTTLCFFNDSGIIWDNVLGGLIMMDTRGNTETSTSGNPMAKVSSKWSKQWWTANWLWGSKRGEIGYKITIYYSGSTVSNTDVSDWGSISLGKAKSESKILKSTGAYGQCRYALGLCTPLGSLSFNTSNFTVSFSGLGSNVVSNGTKSLYP
ncbi:hypothetical protein [Chryseobacterium gossypii]|uniref:hypothetical protein n=1 Tax=Chryseobacterium gossypii TaxID=3231602 RepID=UPI0035264504